MAIYKIKLALRTVGKGLKSPENPSFCFGSSDSQAARDRNQMIRRGTL